MNQMMEYSLKGSL